MEEKKVKVNVWANADWTLPASEIAKQVGRNVQTVYQAARDRGIELPRQKSGPPCKIDYSKVDWKGKSLAQLAREYGVSRQTMLNHRPAEFAPEKKAANA